MDRMWLVLNWKSKMRDEVGLQRRERVRRSMGVKWMRGWVDVEWMGGWVNLGWAGVSLNGCETGNFEAAHFSANLLCLAGIYISSEDCVDKRLPANLVSSGTPICVLNGLTIQSRGAWISTDQNATLLRGLRHIGKALSLISPNAPPCFAALFSMVWRKKNVTKADSNKTKSCNETAEAFFRRKNTIEKTLARNMKKTHGVQSAVTIQ